MITAKEAKRLQSFGGELKLIEDINIAITDAAKEGKSLVMIKTECGDLTKEVVVGHLEDRGFKVESISFESFGGGDFLKVIW